MTKTMLPTPLVKRIIHKHKSRPLILNKFHYKTSIHKHNYLALQSLQNNIATQPLSFPTNPRQAYLTSREK